MNYKIQNSRSERLRLGWACSSMIEHILSNCEAMGSIPTNKNQKKKERER
jgi:hypothetical protein